MQIFLYQNEEQVGPYTEQDIRNMVASGAIAATDLGWYEGLAEWQSLNSIFQFAPTPPARVANQAPTQVSANPVETNVKQGAIIGGFVCFILGIILMFLSMWSFMIYGPLFFVSFVLSIVAMSQRRVTGGLVLLLATLIVPSVIGLVLFVTRTAKVVENLTGFDETMLEQKCLSNAKQIALGCRLYASDNNDKFPAKLDDLFPTYLQDRQILVSPLSATKEALGYDYFGAGGSDGDDGKKILLLSKDTAPDGRRVIVYYDNTGEIKASPNPTELVASQSDQSTTAPDDSLTSKPLSSTVVSKPISTTAIELKVGEDAILKSEFTITTDDGITNVAAGSTVKVVSIDGNDVTVQWGNVNHLVKKDDLTPVTGGQPSASQGETPPQLKHAELDAKMGFRTYKLGTAFSQFNPADLQAGEAFIKSDVKAYYVQNFDKQLGAAEIDDIELDFDQDILQKIQVRVTGKQSVLALKETLIKAYGSPDKDENEIMETMTWEGEDCVLELGFDLSGGATATFSSKTVDAKIKDITEQKAKAGAATGANSL